MRAFESTVVRHGVTCMTSLIMGLAAFTLSTAALSAQNPPVDPPEEQIDARTQARQVLSPEVFAQVQAEATALEVSGIDPAVLYRKALEGAAKRVPADRLVPGVLQYAERLRTARTAFLSGAPDIVRVETPLVVAGADALQRGVPPELLGRLGDDGAARTPLSVLVLADLVETGIGNDLALTLVREAVQTRTQNQRMLEIPAEVRQLLRQGRSPADVAEEMRRALRRRGGGDLTRPAGGRAG